jgi:ribose transport system substrate-binding protein
MNRASKTLAALGAAALLLGVSACGGGSTNAEAESPASASSDKKLTIAFVMGAVGDPFFKAMKVGAEEAAREENVNLEWQGSDTEYSPQTQIPFVDAVLAKKIDGLVLIPTDPDALQPSVAKAKSLNIPVITVDTTVNDRTDVSAFITGDNEDGGAKAADALAAAMKYADGKTYKVVVGSSSATTTTGIGRMKGFESQIAAKYPGIKIVDKAYSQSKPEVANTNVNNWLTKYPDLAGIFAIDGTNATGAASALQAKNLVGKVALIGYDAYKENVDLLKQGIFTAMIAQDPAQEAKLAIKAMVSQIKTGKTGIENEVVIPNVTMTQENLGETEKYTYVE